MPKGGRREGAGGKVGVLKKRTLAMRAVADKALKSGCTPLDVMLDNMMHFHREAKKITEGIMATIDLGNVRLKNEKAATAFKDLVDRFNEATHLRMKAQACAKDAAPFVHPSLKSITVSSHATLELKRVDPSMTPQQAAQLWNDRRANLQIAYQKTIDGEVVKDDEREEDSVDVK